MTSGFKKVTLNAYTLFQTGEARIKLTSICKRTLHERWLAIIAEDAAKLEHQMIPST